MSGSTFVSLFEVSLATSLAVLVVAVLRKPFRYFAGARAAYGLWLLVPASAVALLLPAPAEPFEHSIPVLRDMTLSAVAHLPTAEAGESPNHARLALAAWVAGSVLMCAAMVRRHRRFVRSLGPLHTGADGIQRSASAVGPMLLGVWRPRVVLPADFESRYEAPERAWVLAHEHAHRQSGDALVNAAASGWLCLFWFNPLMYWATGRLRFDQELACDARVLSRFNPGRRQYAAALLKTQLAADSGWRTSIGCHWQSSHPLKERIAMLQRPLPGFQRRVIGIALTCVCIVSASYTAWAVQPENAAAASKVLGIDASVAVSADQVLMKSNDEAELKGNVTLKPLDSSLRPKIASASMRQGTQGLLAEGDVSIELGHRLFKTDRATVMPDGTIRMDAARSYRLPSARSSDSAAPNSAR